MCNNRNINAVWIIVQDKSGVMNTEVSWMFNKMQKGTVKHSITNKRKLSEK